MPKISINLVTYERADHTGRNQKRPISSANKVGAQTHKPVVAANGNTESYGNNTDSLYMGNESSRLNDFVIDRESMQFRKVPSSTAIRHDWRVDYKETAKNQPIDDNFLQGAQEQFNEVIQGRSDEIKTKQNLEDTKNKDKKSSSGGGASQTINQDSIQAVIQNDMKDDMKSLKTV